MPSRSVSLLKLADVALKRLAFYRSAADWYRPSGAVCSMAGKVQLTPSAHEA